MRLPIPTLTILALPLLVAATPAAATGGLDCSISDKALTLAFDAGFPYSLPGLLNPKGEAAIAEARLPDSLRKLDLAPPVLAQHWFNGDTMNFQFYKETAEGEFASVDIVIETKRPPDEDFAYEGTYRLKLQLPGQNADGTAIITEVSGPATCQAG